MAFCALLVSGTAQPVLAQDVCNTMAKLSDHSINNFSKIAGAQDPDFPEERIANLLLPGADECTIEVDEYDATYVCSWSFISENELSEEYRSFSNTIGKCLNVNPKEYNDFPSTFGNTRPIGSIRFENVRNENPYGHNTNFRISASTYRSDREELYTLRLWVTREFD